MTLRPRLLLINALVSFVAALILLWAVERVRARDARVALERAAEAHISDVTRESCETDPKWFLAGPRQDRPAPSQRSTPDADVHLPRPSQDELPFEFFAYDEEFLGSSVASPRFPNEFRRAMRSSPPERRMVGTYRSAAGTGWQVGHLTGWSPGPCAVLLFRSWPPPNQTIVRLGLFVLLFAVSFGVAIVVAGPTVRRIQRLTAAARESARNDYSATAPLTGRDEISALSFVFNEAASDIRKRIVDVNDREEALRRHVVQTTEDVASPLAAVEARLAGLDNEELPVAIRTELHQLIRETYRLASRLENLAAVARLRASAEHAPRELIDMNSLVERLVTGHEPLAAASGVTLNLSPVARRLSPVMADPALVERAVANIIGNAIIYNQRGGHVDVKLERGEADRQFLLRVIDDGPGVSDEEFAGLTANRRFRGDEARSRRPGGRGLGLAVAREVADRFGLQLDIHRRPSGGLEVTVGTG